MSDKRLEQLKELYERSTKSPWWPYPYEKQIRGPFHRWFQPVDAKRWLDEDELNRDIEYAAAAMRDIPHLLSLLAEAREALREISELLPSNTGEPVQIAVALLEARGIARAALAKLS